jgi:acetyltransferase-like isoleucine patch superfamily enzyme
MSTKTMSPSIGRLHAVARRIRQALPVRLQCLLVQLRSRGHLSRGAGSYVHRSVQILGRASVAIGGNSVLSQDTWLNVNHRETGSPAIVVGSNCFVGRRNFFSSGHLIELKDYVLTANDCHFLGSTHIVDDPFVPVMLSGTTASAVISLGVNTFVGAGARVVGNVKIGHGCVIGAASVVTRDVPPFSQVVGNPATVRRRYSMARSCWVPLAEFSDLDEAALPAETAYLAELTRRGGIAMPYLAAGADMGDC